MTKYIATVGLTNDKTGKRYGPKTDNKIVEDGDFPKYVIEDWIKRGRLVEEVPDGSDSDNGKD